MMFEMYSLNKATAGTISTFQIIINFNAIFLQKMFIAEFFMPMMNLFGLRAAADYFTSQFINYMFLL